VTAPASQTPTTASKAERLQAIHQGDWKRALAQGSIHRKALEGRWTLRLEIACQGSTVQQAAEILKDQDPDLFLVPMVLRDGQTCYQVFLGSFGSEAAARLAAQKLPPPFRVEGNRPKPFRVAQIPDRQ
jgi:septal ring-binding cell division protein DamX